MTKQNVLSVRKTLRKRPLLVCGSSFLFCSSAEMYNHIILPIRKTVVCIRYTDEPSFSNRRANFVYYFTHQLLLSLFAQFLVSLSKKRRMTMDEWQMGVYIYRLYPSPISIVSHHTLFRKDKAWLRKIFFKPETRSTPAVARPSFIDYLHWKKQVLLRYRVCRFP